MTERSTLQSRWAAMVPRERRMVGIAVAIILFALLWWIAIGPAWRTLVSAPAEHARLDAELQRMAALQARAVALQSQPRAQRDDALRALETSVQQSLTSAAQLGTTPGAEAATVALRGAPADALARWLAQARSNARAVPREVHLTRSAQPTSASPGAATPTVRWDGALIMTLPASR